MNLLALRQRKAEEARRWRERWGLAKVGDLGEVVAELVILIGLQAAGKSTFRREMLDATHVVVSKDLLRSNRRPGRRQAKLVREALQQGRAVVVDNTNARVEDRLELIRLARELQARVVGYWLRSSVEESLKRNAEREGAARVPDVGVLATVKAFVPPTWGEGFDELYQVELDAAWRRTITPLARGNE